MSASTEALLRVEGLGVQFAGEGGPAQVLRDCSLHVARGEVMALVGESGSGKSVTSLAVMGLLPQPMAKPTAGEIIFDGERLLRAFAGGVRMDEQRLQRLRGRRMAMIFQDPMTSLNPYLRVERQLTEVLELHTNQTGAEARRRALALLEQVGIADVERRARAYPHELSGGMRQRVMIAMALLCEPELLIADEPTTALDVTVQAQVLSLMAKLQQERGMAMLLITHDLGVVAGMADRVAVMYSGQIVEEQPARGLFAAPQHPYTRGLLASLPRMDRELGAPLQAIAGMPPDPRRRPSGCAFHPRCGVAGGRCQRELPGVVDVNTRGYARCFAITPEGTT